MVGFKESSFAIEVSGSLGFDNKNNADNYYRHAEEILRLKFFSKKQMTPKGHENKGQCHQGVYFS